MPPTSRKVITEVPSAPVEDRADTGPKTDAPAVVANALRQLRGPGGPLIDPERTDLYDAARAFIGLLPAGWHVGPTDDPEA